MYSANPFSSYDLLPLHEKRKVNKQKKAQGGLTLDGEDPPSFGSSAQNAAGAYPWKRMGQSAPVNPDPVNPTNLIEIQDEPQYSFQDQGRTIPEKKQKKPFPTELLYTGLTTLAALIPDKNTDSPVVRPGESYNEHPYGTGSQALAKYGKKISYDDGGDPQPKPKPKKKTIVFAESPSRVHPKYNLEDKGLPEGLKHLSYLYLKESKEYNNLNTQIYDANTRNNKIRSDTMDKIIKTTYPSAKYDDPEHVASYLRWALEGDTDAFDYLKTKLPKEVFTIKGMEGLRDLNNRLKNENSYKETKEYIENEKLVKSAGKKQQSYAQRMGTIGESFYNPELNPEVKEYDQDFVKEANNLKSFYNRTNPNMEVDINPVYSSDSTMIKNKIQSATKNDDVVLLGHHGSRFAGLDNNWWADNLKNSKYKDFYLGSCHSDDCAKNDFKDTRNFTYRPEGYWWGVNPNATNIKDAMYSRVDKERENMGKRAKIVNPVKGTDYNTINTTSDSEMRRFRQGGKIKYPYGGEIGGEDPLQPIPKKELYTSKTLKEDTDFARSFTRRKTGPSFLADNTTVGNVGDPRVQFEYQNPKLNETTNPQYTLPRGVSVDDVFQTQQGQYGYVHPQNGNFVSVDPQAIHSIYGKKKAAPDPTLLAKNENGGIIKAEDGHWMQDATASIKRRGTKGKCTPITKPGCTGRAKALAKTFKKIARNRKHEEGGLVPYFEEGGSYDLSDQQVADLISQGYELEMK